MIVDAKHTFFWIASSGDAFPEEMKLSMSELNALDRVIEHINIVATSCHCHIKSVFGANAVTYHRLIFRQTICKYVPAICVRSDAYFRLVDVVGRKQRERFNDRIHNSSFPSPSSGLWPRARMSRHPPMIQENLKRLQMSIRNRRPTGNTPATYHR